MSETDRRSDQEARDRIRNAFDETLLVEAAAGTGKTTELVHRMVGLLAAGRTTIDRVVAVTFTEKAAGELKLRLRERLERDRAAEADLWRRSHLERALARLEEARINTIHGFCADLLRERPVEALVDPDFEVLVEAQAERLYGRVFADWFARQLEHPPEGLRRALMGRVADEDNDEGPVDRLRRAGWDLATWREFRAAWRRDAAFDRAGEAFRLCGRLREFCALTASPARRGDNLYVDTWFIRQADEDLDHHAGARHVDEIEGRLVALARHRLRARMRKGSGAEYAPGISRAGVLAARDALFAELEAFAQAADADLAAALQLELSDTVDLFQQAKVAKGQLDFVDLLVSARDLLRDHEEVRADLQARFERIFVDEFQDTDPVQAEILLLLAGSNPQCADWRRLRVDPGKLFIVADPKQSIYRFRRADVGIYDEVKQLLAAQGVEPLALSTSFRAVPSIQAFVNRAFEPVMQRNGDTLQADYVPLRPWRSEAREQPSVVALPVPEPYGLSMISGAAIEKSLPAAVGAFVHWLVGESGWTVTERTRTDGPEVRVRIQPRHICILFRRFESWGRDVTRPYVEALEARDVPHLLVGGRSFHDREEIDTMKAALAAIEWPSDELAVFATLRGALFALGDAALLAWRQHAGRFNPFRVPDVVPPEFADVADALALLRRLHARRNRVPIAETIGALLTATRAHAGLVLRPSGEQALANVLHIAELARRHELAGGISFRGFVEDLLENRFTDETEAPILEEGGDGVRLMTLHKAKGLEFPVVVLADITANLVPRRASRYVAPAAGLCAMPLAGCRPHDLVEHEAEELAREREEGIRVAYVAATRARDLLVVPAVGDAPYGNGERWVSVLNDALYPPIDQRACPEPAPTCPEFRGKDTVLSRPSGDPARATTVRPGRYRFAALTRGPGGGGAAIDAPDDRGEPAATGAHEPSVVWWDPSLLDLDRRPSHGLRDTELIGRDADPARVAADVETFRSWDAGRARAIAEASRPAVTVTQATRRAVEESQASLEGTAAFPVEVLEVSPRRSRAAGVRFGTLVHAVLAVTPLDAATDTVEDVARAQGRTLGATELEIRAAADAVSAALAHPVLQRARRADARGLCRRETPVAWVAPDGALVEGQVDLAFREEEDAWQVVDFKTDHDLARGLETYRRQVAIYARALATATGVPARGVLLKV